MTILLRNAAGTAFVVGGHAMPGRDTPRRIWRSPTSTATDVPTSPSPTAADDTVQLLLRNAGNDGFTADGAGRRRRDRPGRASPSADFDGNGTPDLAVASTDRRRP